MSFDFIEHKENGNIIPNELPEKQQYYLDLMNIEHSFTGRLDVLSALKKLKTIAMKKFITLYLCTLIVFSCTKSLDGDWEDNINVSQKEVHNSAVENNIEITTKGKGWWINGIWLDKIQLDLNGIDTTKENFIIEKNEFSIERKSSTEIYITMRANPADSIRILGIGLQSGNYFDGITITQSGN